MAAARLRSAGAPQLPAGPQGREGPGVAVRGQRAARACGGRAALPAAGARGQDQHGAQQRLVRAADQLGRGPGACRWPCSSAPAWRPLAGADPEPAARRRPRHGRWVRPALSTGPCRGVLGAPADTESPRMHSMRREASCERDVSLADFQISIFADPVYRGDWPASVKERAPPNLLPITPDLVRPRLSAVSIFEQTARWCSSWPGVRVCVFVVSKMLAAPGGPLLEMRKRFQGSHAQACIGMPLIHHS